jgi:class 3 adenylate cyclase/tetratricopeptide (TPR) repeat protein
VGSYRAPYLPRVAAEWDLDTPEALWREVEATLCFVDISGFTALSERLARRGRIGAEELTEVLNHVFSRMLHVAYEKGGSLLKFGGDALLLAFFEGDHAVDAANAAVAMRATLREARTLPTSVGRLQLRMSVGIHTGTYELFRVGRLHHEFLVAGPSATAVTRMEQTAEAGEIVVSAATAARLPAAAVGAPKGDGYLLRRRRAVDGGNSAREIRAVEGDAIERAIPIELREHLGTGRTESEHRLATVGFVKFTGTDALLESSGIDATARAIDAVVTAVQEDAATEGLTFLSSDVDADGGKMILLAGVPTAREDDEGRMLRTARLLVDRELPLPVRVGVNRGHVFAGEIGTEFRRAYTVMGDTVNLAARLMAAAGPNEVYATGGVLDVARTRFATQALAPLQVKGKSQPIQAYAVGVAEGVRDRKLSDLPFAGREVELAVLRKAEPRMPQGRGATVIIEGGRGIGKSRLVEEYLAAATRPVLRLQGEAYATATPYMPFRAPLRELFGITSNDREKVGDELTRGVRAINPVAEPFAPLLAPMVGADVASTPETDAIAPEFARERLADLLVDILDAASPSLCIVAEDAHWFDDASASLGEHLAVATASRPWLMLIVRRPAPSGLRPAAATAELLLEPLDESTASALIDEVTAAAPLRPQERDALVGRAAGNPLFIGELLRVARTSDLDALPETLDALAMREIDALPPVARRVIRVASVLGRTFDWELLLELLGQEHIELDASTRESLDPFLTSHSGQVQFRHALLQEAAYESLPFRRRIAMHSLAGKAIELGRDTTETAPALSWHFSRAQDWPRTWKYARIAGHSARDAFAPAEAAAHLERALLAARRLGDIAPEEIATLLTELGEALIVLGQFEKADDAYRRAAANVKNDPIAAARLRERRSYVKVECQRDLKAARRHVRAGTRLLETLPLENDDAARVRVQLYAVEAEVLLHANEYAQAARLCGQVMVEAEALGELRALATAMSILDECMYALGRPADAVHMRRALEAYEELGDRVKVAIMLGNLGANSYNESDWVAASEYFDRAAQASLQAGDVATAAVAHVNQAELRAAQGHLEEAEALLVPAVRTLQAVGDRGNIAAATVQLGRTRALLGRPDQGIELLQSAIEMYERLEVRRGAAEAWARIAEVHLVSGASNEAEDALSKARELGGTLADSLLDLLFARIEATASIVRGDRAAAERQLEQAVLAARRIDASYELLLLLALEERLGGSGSASERDELQRALGVVELVPLPTPSACR